MLLDELHYHANTLSFFRVREVDNLPPVGEAKEFGTNGRLPGLEIVDIAQHAPQLFRAADHAGLQAGIDGGQHFKDHGRVGAGEDAARAALSEDYTFIIEIAADAPRLAERR